MQFKTTATALAAFLAAACARPPADQDVGTVVTHVAESVTVEALDEFRIERQFAGLILPRQSTDIGFERDGEVLELLTDEGDRVGAGDVIARLDTELLDAERDDLNAQLDELAARLKLNAANLERSLSLRDRGGFAADQQIDELSAERDTLTANRGRVNAALAANAERLDQSVLVAPFGGTVSRRFVDDGAVVGAGAPVLRIIESAALEARVGIPVRLAAQVAPGDAVRVLAAKRELAGRVITVGNDVTRATLTLPVRIAIDDAGDAVPGDQAWLQLEESVDQAGSWVPVTALTDGLRGLWNVYALLPEEGAGYRLEARDVRILYATEEQAYVAGAIADGEQIVANGLARLVPGQRVELATMPAPATAEETGP
ncbi:MAG: efflux RND transporter periplasmic adaptor subunit [Pseudomonadota bacterium]